MLYGLLGFLGCDARCDLLVKSVKRRPCSESGPDLALSWFLLADIFIGQLSRMIVSFYDEGLFNNAEQKLMQLKSVEA